MSHTADHHRDGRTSVVAVTMVPVNALGSVAQARIGRWPYEPDVAQIVLLDHHMVPTTDAVERWVDDALRGRPRSIRTGALFPAAADAFRAAGFLEIDTLVLLEAHLGAMPVSPRRRRASTRRLSAGRLGDAATVDRAAFGDPWSNDEDALRDIAAATPHHRSRAVGERRLEGFAISGQSGRAGYLQRLAVHPHARRRGHARALVADSLHWMRRRGARRAYVNTAVDNTAALGLYQSFGFDRRAESLSILELSVR